MKKIFLIGWKDLVLAFRDRAALILMLAAPFALTLGLGFVTGSFSGSNNTGISQIPVVLVNQDGAELGDALAELFSSQDLAELVAPAEMDDPALARQEVDADRAAAAVIIPAGFTRSILPAPGAAPDTNTATNGEAAQIEIYANPTRPVGSGVVQAIVEEFTSRVEIGKIAGQVAVMQLISSRLVDPEQAENVGREIGAHLAAEETQVIQLKKTETGAEPVQFNPLAYMAPAMALLFLMYTVTYGGRSLLVERSQGTLPRLLVSPTRMAEIMGGKVLGIFLTGLAQLLILIAGSSLLFNLKWGDTVGVVALVMAAVFGATGWGMLITALARTPGQVSSVGSAVMLTFGILGGSFISLEAMPPAIQLLSKLTPNAWGLNGFTTLALGGTLADLAGPILALVVMGAALFAVAVLLFNRQSSLQK